MPETEEQLSLLEALDHLLDRGVVIAGEAVISIADVDLLYLGLNVVLANVDTIMRVRGKGAVEGAATREIAGNSRDPGARRP